MDKKRKWKDDKQSECNKESKFQCSDSQNSLNIITKVN